MENIIFIIFLFFLIIASYKLIPKIINLYFYFKNKLKEMAKKRNELERERIKLYHEKMKREIEESIKKSKRSRPNFYNTSSYDDSLKLTLEEARRVRREAIENARRSIQENHENIEDMLKETFKSFKDKI